MKLATAAIVLAVVTAGCFSTHRTVAAPASAKMAALPASLDRVAVVPPETIVLRSGLFGGSEPEPATARVAADRLSQLIVAELEQRGFDAQLASARNGGRERILDLRTRFAKNGVLVYRDLIDRSGRRPARRTFAPDAVRDLAGVVGADAIVLARLAHPAPSGTSLRVTIVEAETGEILWANWVTAEASPEEPGELVDLAFRDFPPVAGSPADDRRASHPRAEGTF